MIDKVILYPINQCSVIKFLTGWRSKVSPGKYFSCLTSAALAWPSIPGDMINRNNQVSSFSFKTEPSILETLADTLPIVLKENN